MRSTWLPIGLAAATSAAMFLSTVIGSPGAFILAYLSMLPLFLVGLSLGWIAGGASALAAVLAVGIAANAWVGLLYLVTIALPPTLLSQRALLARPAGDDPDRPELEWYPPGLLLIWLAALPATALLLTFLYTMNAEGGLEGVTRQGVERLFETFEPDMRSMRLTEADVDRLRETIVANLPAWSSLQWAFVILVNGVLAQGALVRFGRNLRPSPRMYEIELPRWAPWPMAGALAVGMLGGSLGYLGWNIVPALALPFFLSGYGVAHAALRRRPGRLGLLGLGYALVLVNRWVVVFAVLVGLVDHWAKLKARLNARAEKN